MQILVPFCNEENFLAFSSLNFRLKLNYCMARKYVSKNV
jgi:hypothetical protein